MSTLTSTPWTESLFSATEEATLLANGKYIINFQVIHNTVKDGKDRYAIILNLADGKQLENKLSRKKIHPLTDNSSHI